MRLLALAAAFLLGSVPFSQVVAASTRGLDLRRVETGTVSGTSLYRVAGFWPLVVAGVLDVAKGAAAALAGKGAGGPVWGALAAGCAVAGHNWSPWLKGAGGRGLSVAFGATAMLAWPGTVALGIGMAAGKLAGNTGFGCFLAYLGLVPLLALTHGPAGALLGAAIVVPMLLKRLTGNGPPAAPQRGRVYRNRLLFDRDDHTGHTRLCPRKRT